jgi:hypothetical protein
MKLPTCLYIRTTHVKHEDFSMNYVSLNAACRKYNTKQYCAQSKNSQMSSGIKIKIQDDIKLHLMVSDFIFYMPSAYIRI